MCWRPRCAHPVEVSSEATRRAPPPYPVYYRRFASPAPHGAAMSALKECPMHIALVAHARMKDRIVALAQEFAPFLR